MQKEIISAKVLKNKPAFQVRQEETKSKEKTNCFVPTDVVVVAERQKSNFEFTFLVTYTIDS